MSVKLRYGYRSAGIDGRTEDEHVREFDVAEEAKAWAWNYVVPIGAMDGSISVRCEPIDGDEWPVRARYAIDANWRSVADEPYSVYVWAEWSE